MKVKEKLEEHLEKLSKLLTDGLGTLEGLEGDPESVAEIAEALKTLGDTLHQRLNTGKTDTKWVRLTRVNVATLSVVLCKWADALDSLSHEMVELNELIEKDWKKLDSVTDDFNKTKGELEDLLEEQAPVLNLDSELRDAERI